MIEELNDPEVKKHANNFLTGMVESEQVRTAFIKLVQDVFSSEESINTMVNLLQKGITNVEVQKALSESINFGVREVLAD